MNELARLRQNALNALALLATAESDLDIKACAELSLGDLQWFIAGHTSACPMECSNQHSVISTQA